MSRLLIDVRSAGGPLTPAGAYARHLTAGIQAAAPAAGHVAMVIEAGPLPSGDLVVLPGGGRPHRRLPTAACIPDLAYLLRRSRSPLSAARDGIRTAFTAHRADLVFAPTAEVAEGVQRYLRAHPPLIVPPGVAPGFGRTEAAAARSAAADLGVDGRYVLAAGDPSLARQAWATIPPAGAELVILEERPARDLAALLSGAVGFLALDRANGCPALALLAMACGCPPVVASDGAYGQLVRDAGLVADPDQPREWGECVAALLRSPALRSQLSGRALEIAESMPAVRSAELLLAALAPLLAATAAPGADR